MSSADLKFCTSKSPICCNVISASRKDSILDEQKLHTLRTYNAATHAFPSNFTLYEPYTMRQCARAKAHRLPRSYARGPTLVAKVAVLYANVKTIRL